MKYAVFKIKALLLFVLLFQNQLLFGTENTDHDQEKCYITENDIALCDEGIAILGTESLIVAEGLFHDENGFYFLVSGARWKCNCCLELNSLDNHACQACRQPYGSSPPKKSLLVVAEKPLLGQVAAEGIEMQETPKYLYKVLSLDDWQKSGDVIHLSPADHEFIHFATEEQLPKIIDKYWKDIPEFMVLKIETQKLSGRLVYESNPGGATKYYHLYEGYITRDAVVEATRGKH